MLDMQSTTSCPACTGALHIEVVLRFGYRGVRWWLDGPLVLALTKFARPLAIEPRILEEAETGHDALRQVIALGASRLVLRCTEFRIEASLCCREPRFPHAAALERVIRAVQPAWFAVQFSPARPVGTTRVASS